MDGQLGVQDCYDGSCAHGQVQGGPPAKELWPGRADPASTHTRTSVPSRNGRLGSCKFSELSR